MDVDTPLLLSRLLYALLAGGFIGLERTLHGREAGFRTHALVCVSSSLLMVLMTFQWQLIPAEYIDTIRTDPTRMAQGIMTGIGFLGAGVIIKEGLTVRGLTTAASIWMTATIGIVIGIGFYEAAIYATLITIIILSMFRWVESKVPSIKYAQLKVRFLRSNQYADEDALRDLINEHNIKFSETSYQLDDHGNAFTYNITLKTKNSDNLRRLADSLKAIEDVHEFKLTPFS